MTNTCTQCGRQRGKKNKPWNNCSKCDRLLCLTCCPSSRALISAPKCSKCWGEDYDEKENTRQATPVECQTCHGSFLPADMENSYVPTVCKLCAESSAKLHREERLKEKRQNAVVGLVEVEYSPNSGAYAYDANGLRLEIGDVVLVPATWVDAERTPREATVVSLLSDYTGVAQRIISLVHRERFTNTGLLGGLTSSHRKSKSKA